MSITAEDLAKRFGGTVAAPSPEDLAKQFGGSVTDNAPTYGGKTLEQRQAESKAAFEANQPSWFSRYFNRSGIEKAKEQVGNVVSGIPQAVTGIPAAITGARDMVNGLLSGNLAPAERAATAVTNPVMTPLKQAIELAKPGLVNAPSPDAPETAAAAQGAGTLLGGAAIGEAAEGFPHVPSPIAAMKSRIAAVDPTALIERANALREDAPSVKGTLNSIQLTKPLTVATGINDLVKPLRASALERFAKFADSQHPPVQGAMVLGPDALAVGEGESVAAPRSAAAGNVPPVGVPEEAAAAPYVAPKPIPPELPQFQRDALQRLRETETPEELYAREQAIRNQEIPPAPTADTRGATPVYKPPPDTGLPEMMPKLDAPTLNRAMNISEKQVARGANPGARVLDEKLLGKTPVETKANVDAALADSGTKLQSALSDAGSNGVTIDAQDMVQNALEGATKRIGTPKDVIFQNNLNGVLDDIMKRYPNIDKLSPEQAHSLKVELGDAVSWNGPAYDSPVNRAMVRIYSDLNTAIKDNVPGIGAEQSRWGDLYNASKGLKKTLDRATVGRSLWNKVTGQSTQ